MYLHLSGHTLAFSDQKVGAAYYILEHNWDGEKRAQANFHGIVFKSNPLLSVIKALPHSRKSS